MSKRITLSVPEPLHQQIERWRNSFNLSRVFQEAVADVIRRKEELQARLGAEIPEIIARLRREKEAVEQRWFKEGERLGLEWAKAASYIDLQRVLPQPAEALADPGGDLRDYFSQVVDFERRRQELADGFEEFRRSFLKGWHAGVEQFWAIVKDQL